MPPSEMDTLYPEAWAEGIDRWYGQTMKPEQVQKINWYLGQTQFYAVPPWVFGLRYATTNKRCLSEMCLPWGYGLDSDCELLSRYRLDRQLPFACMPGLLDKLDARKKDLSGLTP